jgi:molybdenum cofactor guanylyltransferase
MPARKNLYILCGGESRRMGADKARLNLDGRTFLDIMIQKGKPYFHEIILLTGKNHYPLENRQLNDQFSGYGPLSGLLTALTDAENMGQSCIALVPVDLPLLSKNSLHFLSEETTGPESDALIARANESIQPLVGIFHVRLISKLKEFLNRNEPRVMGFIKTLSYSCFSVTDDEIRNINTPEEYRKISLNID